MTDYEKYLKEQFRLKVYNALSEVGSEFPEIDDEIHRKNMEEAIEWFMTKFYNLDEE